MSEEEKVVVEVTEKEIDIKDGEKEIVVETMEQQLIYDPNLPVITMKKLLESGAHFGHQTRKWNPKMKQYIYTARNGIYIIDLEKTVMQITKAYLTLHDIVKDQGKVLFVGTKTPAQKTIQEEAERSGSFYVNNRWLGGTLTNFRTIRTRIQRLIEIEQMEADGLLERLTKKEQAIVLKEKDKLAKNLSGIKEIRKLPNAIVVVDPLHDTIAVKEARKLGIIVIGTASTNCDPDLLDIAIPVNDDSPRSIRLVMSVLADAIVEAKGSIPLVAHTPDVGEDVTMRDVVNNADKVNRERLEQIRQARKERQEQYERNRAAYQARHEARQREDGKDEAKPRRERKPAAKAEAPKEEVKEVEAPSEE